QTSPQEQAIQSKVVQVPKAEESDVVIINPSVIESDMKILGREKMLHIINLFRTTSADVLSKLQASAEDNDSKEVKNLAHKLKGSAGSLGLTALMNACQAIEAAPQPLDTYNATKDDLVSQVSASIQALDELLAK
ncbi:Hpt domain-containing protein, partial [Vibrio parahaemolyticus]|uniref:Hpt domain-containing protein n=1 Tax=Vibrio parahaemolyticus TaxID=670 RepID=UPI00146CFE57